MGYFENHFSRDSFWWGNCNHLLCVRSRRLVTLETWTGTQLVFAIRACYRNKKYFRESAGLFPHYFPHPPPPKNPLQAPRNEQYVAVTCAEKLTQSLGRNFQDVSHNKKSALYNEISDGISTSKV
jgi:hypothetical protein